MGAWTAALWLDAEGMTKQQAQAQLYPNVASLQSHRLKEQTHGT